LRPVASLQRLLIEVDLHAVERIVQVLRRARDKRSMVFIAGNGGSASNLSMAASAFLAKARRKVHLQAQDDLSRSSRSMAVNPHQCALSVVIACYNGAETLPVQLEALSTQEWSRPWELVLADNGRWRPVVARG
jgi:hypothetical protein